MVSCTRLVPRVAVQTPVRFDHVVTADDAFDLCGGNDTAVHPDLVEAAVPIVHVLALPPGAAHHERACGVPRRGNCTSIREDTVDVERDLVVLGVEHTDEVCPDTGLRCPGCGVRAPRQLATLVGMEDRKAPARFTMLQQEPAVLRIVLTHGCERPALRREAIESHPRGDGETVVGPHSRTVRGDVVVDPVERHRTVHGSVRHERGATAQNGTTTTFDLVDDRRSERLVEFPVSDLHVAPTGQGLRFARCQRPVVDTDLVDRALPVAEWTTVPVRPADPELTTGVPVVAVRIRPRELAVHVQQHLPLDGVVNTDEVRPLSLTDPSIRVGETAVAFVVQGVRSR